MPAAVIEPPWLSHAIASLRTACAAGRLPHGLLIHEAPGAGGEWLARWIAQRVLCQYAVSGDADRAPCGECPACVRVACGQHPDLINVRPSEESRQIRIEQLRELAQELSLTAHQGGYKVAVLAPADSLNRFAANALLKTLEEPPPRTLLVLVATQPSRLPATILSRCQRIRVAAPSREQAISWLESTHGKGDWRAVLDVLGDAPMLAAACDAAAVVQAGSEVRRTLAELVARAGDPVTIAERWSRSELPLRLRCIENWLTEQIRGRFAGGGSLTEVGAGAYFPPAESVLNICELFELLDEVHDLKSLLDTPINRGLALEHLLRRVAHERQDALSIAR